MLVQVCQWPRCVRFSANNIMYESLGSGMSDNKVNKESDQAKHNELKRQDSQANRNIMFLRIMTPVSGKARQIFFK